MKKITDATIFYDKIKDQYSFKLHSPLSVCWQITTKCNLTCKYCLSSSGPQNTYGLSTNKAKEVIDMLSEINVNRLDFTGGEPFLRKDLKELIAYSIEKNISPLVTTNTLLLCEDDMKFLAEKNVLVQVSIDGTQTTHNHIRGGDVYNTTLNNIKKLIAFGCKVRLNSFICRSNIQDINSVLKLGENLNIFSHLIILFTPQGRGINFENEILKDEEKENLKDYLMNYMTQTGRYIRLYDYDEYEHSCVLITPEGDVISQALHEKDCLKVGNLFETPLNTLFQNDAFDHFKHLAHYIQRRIKK